MRAQDYGVSAEASACSLLMRAVRSTAVSLLLMSGLVAFPSSTAYADGGSTIHEEEMLVQLDPPCSANCGGQEAGLVSCADGYWADGGYRLPATPQAETYYTNTTAARGLVSADAIADILIGFEVWNDAVTDCVGFSAQSSFHFQRAGETSAAPSLFIGPAFAADGINEVAFIDMGALGRYTPATLAATRVLTDATGRVVEWDMVLDSTKIWGTRTTPGTFDVWNVVTHEVGSVIGLQSTAGPTHAFLTMFKYTWPGDADKRSLGLGDLLGLGVVSQGRPAL